MSRARPLVKYRGLFLNDESPDLTEWVREKYGTVAVPGPAADGQLRGGLLHQFV